MIAPLLASRPHKPTGLHDFNQRLGGAREGPPHSALNSRQTSHIKLESTSTPAEGGGLSLLYPVSEKLHRGAGTLP